VGVYFFAFRLAVQPIRMLAVSFSSVLFPTLGQMNAEPERQYAAALRVSRALAYAIMPLCTLQAALAQPGVSLIFGAKWQGSIPLIQLLSIGLAFDALSWICGALLNARGQFARALKYSSVFAPLFFVAVASGAAMGSALGVAAVVSLYYMLLGPIYTFLVLRDNGVGLQELSAIYFTPFLVSLIAMFVPVAALYLLGSSDPIISILVISSVGISIYLVILRLIAPDLVRQVHGWAKGFIERHFLGKRCLSAQ
jgi:PST family polysaccharide transporter